MEIEKELEDLQKDYTKLERELQRAELERDEARDCLIEIKNLLNQYGY